MGLAGHNDAPAEHTPAQKTPKASTEQEAECVELRGAANEAPFGNKCAASSLHQLAPGDAGRLAYDREIDRLLKLARCGEKPFGAEEPLEAGQVTAYFRNTHHIRRV